MLGLDASRAFDGSARPQRRVGYMSFHKHIEIYAGLVTDPPLKTDCDMWHCMLSSRARLRELSSQAWASRRICAWRGKHAHATVGTALRQRARMLACALARELCEPKPCRVARRSQPATPLSSQQLKA